MPPGPDPNAGAAPQFEVHLAFDHAVATLGDRHGELDGCGGPIMFRFAPED